jgi:hypothetical protein
MSQSKSSYKVMFLIGGVFMGGMYFLSMVLNTANDFFNNFSNNDKKKALMDNTQFICKSTLFRNTELHQISKQDGWVIYKEYFKKGDRLIAINSCEEDE